MNTRVQNCVSVLSRQDKIFVGHLLYARYVLNTLHTPCHLFLTSDLRKRYHHNHIQRCSRSKVGFAAQGMAVGVSEVEQRGEVSDIGDVTKS